MDPQRSQEVKRSRLIRAASEVDDGSRPWWNAQQSTAGGSGNLPNISPNFLKVGFRLVSVYFSRMFEAMLWCGFAMLMLFCRIDCRLRRFMQQMGSCCARQATSHPTGEADLSKKTMKCVLMIGPQHWMHWMMGKFVENSFEVKNAKFFQFRCSLNSGCWIKQGGSELQHWLRGVVMICFKQASISQSLQFVCALQLLQFPSVFRIVIPNWLTTSNIFLGIRTRVTFHESHFWSHLYYRSFCGWYATFIAIIVDEKLPQLWPPETANNLYVPDVFFRTAGETHSLLSTKSCFHGFRAGRGRCTARSRWPEPYATRGTEGEHWQIEAVSLCSATAYMQ